MIQFKADNQRQYNRLTMEFCKKLDPTVKTAIKDLNDFAEEHHRSAIGRPLTITCVCRTIEENRRVGGSTYSAHLDTPQGRRAVDLRSRDLTDRELDILLSYLTHL